MKNKLAVSAGLVLGFAPFVAFAQQQGDLSWLIGQIATWLSSIIPILITLAIIYFIWAVIKYTLSTDEEAKSSAKSALTYAIVGLVVIFGMWGIIAFVSSSLGLSGGTPGNFQTPMFNDQPVVQ